MKSAPLRHGLEYGIYLAAKGALTRMPFEAVRRFGMRLGRLAYAVKGSKRRLALRNLKLIFPEWPDAERERVARACFRHFGATFCEVLAASRFDERDVARRFQVEGWEHLDAAVAQGRGVFVLSGHYGRWELAAMPLALRLGGFSLVARPPNNPHVARDIERSRTRFGNEILPKYGAGHRMLNVVRRGGRVALVIDQRVRKSEAIRIPFMGPPAWTTPVLARLSILNRTPVVPAFCTAAGPGGFRLSIRPAIEPEGKGKEAEETLTIRYGEAVEEEVRKDPIPWLWMHRRWD